MVHLGTTSCNLHMLWKTPLPSLPPLALAAFSRTHVDVVLGLMDVVLDGLVSVRPHVSPIFAYRRWPLVVASRPASPHLSRLLGLALRLSRSCLSMPPGNPRRAGRWHLRRKPCVEHFLYVPFPCGILASQFCVFFCLHNTRLLIVNIDCEQYTHTYSTNRACTQHNHISSREHACLKDCASLCPYNNCHPRVMSHLPLFAFSPIFSLTFTDTHNTFGAR